MLLNFSFGQIKGQIANKGSIGWLRREREILSWGILLPILLSGASVKPQLTELDRITSV